MTEVTGCEILNQVDNKFYTLYVEWFNSHFKLMLLEPTIPPLCGEMDTKDINNFSSTLSKSFDEYFEQTKKILCGKDKTINFLIKNETLQWKNNVWTFGIIKLHSILDIQVVCNSLQQLLKLYQCIQDRASLLEEEKQNLMNVNKELNSKVEEMIETKISMERNLYKKFILLLNSKKMKIRELESKINENQQNTEDFVFDATTDESEASEREDHVVEIDPAIVSSKVGKRKSPGNNKPMNTKQAKKIDYNADDKITNKPSSSRHCANNKIDTSDNCKEQTYSSENKKSESSLNLVEEASEEELFSQ
ncbi:uncharacterized protein LOC143422814 [Xylocopa sonorina]|uniref:uncharacterized protein LOC143422814 n=1 Tax=Xylocopa sonorina TaxID=1818115 RepID=UPI00403AE8FC